MARSPVNAFEQERAKRIRRNQEVLASLGLLDNPLSAAAAQRQQRAEAERRQPTAAAAPPPERLQPTRRSRRLQGEQAPHDPTSSYRQRQRQHHLCRVVRSVVRDGVDDQENLDSHNLMRIRSMSDKALRTRIWRIQRVDKLRSFIQMLDACSMVELAAEARQALRRRSRGKVGEADWEAGAGEEEDVGEQP